MPECNRENVWIVTRRKIWENLEEIKKAFVNIYGDLRGGMNGSFFHALPLPMVNRAYQRVALLISGGWDVSDEGRRVFLNEEKINIVFQSF